jgi:myosin XVIII
MFQVVAMFKGCKTEDTPPHLFAWAQSALRSTLTTRRDQALVFLGRTRAGKSLALRRTALYLAASAGPGATPSPWVPKIAAGLTAFGAFTSARGSRCVQLLSLHYDHAGALASASLQGHMLDITRMPSSHRLDGCFDIFNWLIYGCEGQLRRTLLLDNHGATGAGEETSAFVRLTGAFKDLAVTEQEQLCIWRVLAAIWHLCGAGVVKGIIIVQLG